MTTDRDEPLTISTRAELTRRDALRLFGAGLAALQVGCVERTGEEIRPSVRRPEIHPGTPTLYATAMTIDGYATGLLVESHGGRPTKIDGNPLHPASLGGTSAQHQAAILDLYDPHRLRAPLVMGAPATWDRLRRLFVAPPDGETWLLLPPDASPALAAQLARVRARFPRLRVVRDAPVDRAGAHRATTLAFGAPLDAQLAFDRADVIVALDADVLAGMPMSLRWARDFAARRRLVDGAARPPRLFVAEPAFTPTGTLADVRLAIRAGDVAALTVALADALDRRGVPIAGMPGTDVRGALRRRIGARGVQWVEQAADALARRRGAAIVIAGDRQPPAVAALAHRIALGLDAIGTTTTFTEPVIAPPSPRAGAATLADLVASLRAGRAGAVLALDVDPVYAGREPELAALLPRAPLSVHATRYRDDTSAACQWVVPLSHFLESWGDARAWDGTASPIQPLIRPLHDTRSVLELLAMLAGDHAPDDRALVRAQWRAQAATDAAWHAILADGVIPGTASPARAVAARGDAGALADELDAALAAADDGGVEVDLAPSPAVGDGRFATNPWLQELPHPITKLTWGNCAQLGAATAKLLGVGDGDVVRLERDGRAIELPAVIVPGHADRCVTVDLGYGRRTPGSPIADGVGASGYALARGQAIVRGVAAAATGRRRKLPRTQHTLDQHDRHVALHATLAELRANPALAADFRGPLPSLLPLREPPADVPQWAMTIDTTICTGCASCMIACQAENNVPVVGADQVRRGREMHWLRIDTYVADGPHGPDVVNQPMLCQHCEMAPCEYVCPVYATTHSPDGLNEMTYNRCVGTRFCSNNCPYKVRRFNWFSFDKPANLTALQRNPDVTVRSRGVMEKCTFCVQRIRGAEITARMERRAIAPGEVVTACQQACPTGAIQFGALGHAGTPMVQWRESPRLYAVLHELGTRPRTMYLAKIRDPEGT